MRLLIIRCLTIRFLCSLWSVGLFERGHMQFESDRTNMTIEGDGEPSIAEMVEKAIRVLQKSDTGYFLFVEGIT